MCQGISTPEHIKGCTTYCKTECEPELCTRTPTRLYYSYCRGNPAHEPIMRRLHPEWVLAPLAASGLGMGDHCRHFLPPAVRDEAPPPPLPLAHRTAAAVTLSITLLCDAAAAPTDGHATYRRRREWETRQFTLYARSLSSHSGGRGRRGIMRL